MTGREEKIAAFLGLLAPYDLLEVNRTGKVAMHRGLEKSRRRTKDESLL